MLPLPNPSLEPKTHRWRPGAVALSREVPSQFCVVLGQKQPFSPKIAPKTRTKRPKEGERWHTPRASGLHRLKKPSSALQLHDMSEKRTKIAPKSPKKLHHVHQQSETKNRPYLGLRGSKPNSEGT